MIVRVKDTVWPNCRNFACRAEVVLRVQGSQFLLIYNFTLCETQTLAQQWIRQIENIPGRKILTIFRPKGRPLKTDGIKKACTKSSKIGILSPITVSIT